MRDLKRKLMVIAAATVVGTATILLPGGASAAVRDGHTCWWWSPYDTPRNPDANHVLYSQGVICDGLVRSIEITTELRYHGLVNGPAETINGITRSFPNITSAIQGAPTPGAYCSTGYYSGRATATVHYRSGWPEFITRSVTSTSVYLSCNLPPITAPAKRGPAESPPMEGFRNAATNQFVG